MDIQSIAIGIIAACFIIMIADWRKANKQEKQEGGKWTILYIRHDKRDLAMGVMYFERLDDAIKQCDNPKFKRDVAENNYRVLGIVKMINEQQQEA